MTLSDLYLDQHDARVDKALAEYIEAAETGAETNRDEFLARHPSLADDLAAFLDNLRQFRQFMGPPAAPCCRFGDYDLFEEIGRGGMGVVYKARQISLNRIVALKMILAGQLAGLSDVRRFYAEAETAAHLDHPGIV